MTAARAALLITLLGAVQVVAALGLDTQAVAAAPTHPTVPAFSQALALGLGRPRLAADLVWIRVTNYAGDATFELEGRRSMLPLLQLLEELDPEYEPPYYFGGLILATERVAPEQCVNRFLLGEKRFPTQWRYPYLAAAMQMFLLADFGAASASFQRASQLEGAPAIAGQLAKTSRRLLASCDQAQALLERLATMAGGAMGNTLNERARHFQLECLTQDVERATQKWMAAHQGVAPQGIRPLVEAGLLPGHPRHPYGGVFFIRPDGSVESSIPMARLPVGDRAPPEVGP